MRRARFLIYHARFHLFFGERRTSPLLLGVPDENVLESVLVGAGTAHHRRDMRQSGWGDLLRIITIFDSPPENYNRQM